MTDVSLLIKILSVLDIAIIEQSEVGLFQIIGAHPNWFKRLFNYVKQDGKSFAIEDELSFLGSFVTDAVEFWRLQQAEQILWSGPWEEKLDSGEYAILEAGAIYLEGRNVLMIRLFGHHDMADREMLQKAKEHLLSFEELSRTDEEIKKYRDYLEQEVQRQILQVRTAEEKYRCLFDSMTDAFAAVDMTGKIIECNKAYREMVGYSDEELCKMTYADITLEKWHAFESNILEEQVLKKRSSDIYEKEYQRKDGVVFPVELRTFLLTDEAGNPTGMWSIVRDITERKKAEEERKQLELKAQVSSRLASVGEMAAGVAHEINNPLTAVTGYAQLLVDREEIPPDVRSDLAAINDGAKRVAGIIKRLLAFSRQTKPERKLANVNELVQSTLALRAYHLKVNNIKVVINLFPDLPGTVVDPGQIQQVLLNLIVNAEMEMKLAYGKGKLTVTTKKSNSTIRICVTDDGRGIKPEIMDRIFDPFFTTREVGQGTGLGLSLCYGIVAEHNGKIYAENNQGKGATFTVELPVITETPETPEAVEAEPEKKSTAKILVVDDEETIRDLMKRVLTGEGYQVDTIDNAADALKKIESQRYNIILLDIKMQGMDGIELYKRIQKIERSLAKRVIFVTGDIMGADTDKFLSETKVAHIEKPFDATQLRQEVRRALSEG